MPLFDKANRGNGNWLRGVENCTKRAKPCGNPYCLDEAMKSGEGLGLANGILGRLNAEYAGEHAIDIAADCDNPSCPIGKTIEERNTFISNLIKFFSGG